MSGILGIFSRSDRPLDDASVSRMLRVMSRRGADMTAIWRDDVAVLGTTRHAWEMEPGFSGPDLKVEEGGIAVVADASIYYRRELRDALERAGVAPISDAPGHLILAAYRAWGTACAERLEGDWAFIVWDRTTRRVLCSRDFAGRRPMFYAELGDTLVVASTLSAVRLHPRCSDELNLASIASDAAGWFAASHETCYRDIAALSAGWNLIWHNGSARLERHWSPPPVRDAGGPPFEAAAEELRALLSRAVAERLSPIGPTSVWLSGGWDSTAVFGVGERLLRERADDRHLRPVSVSYPPGDPGREDELITAVVEHWDAPVQWLDVADIPMLPRPRERAAEREEPFAHAFESFNRALAAGSRSVGAHVAFDGSGGDQLFQVSPVYLADLFRTGRWAHLAQEAKQRGFTRRDYRSLFRLAVQPALPTPLLRVAEALRGGRPLRGYLERPIPEWIDKEFVRRHGLREREQLHTPPRTGRDRAAYETQWYLAHPFFPRVVSAVSGFALENGIEVRSPLYDRRIIDFAVTRPVSERAAGRETKRLLRHALSGLLPAQVLAPRRTRTGTTGAYLTRSLRHSHAPAIEATFDAPLTLAELGVVDATALRRSWREFVRRGGENLGLHLFFTFQAELWLRTRSGGERRPLPGLRPEAEMLLAR
jgi:asparagine synthase (glutamine-hydrolysing)